MRQMAREEVSGSGIISYSTMEVSDLQEADAELHRRIENLESDIRLQQHEIERLNAELEAARY